MIFCGRSIGSAFTSGLPVPRPRSRNRPPRHDTASEQPRANRDRCRVCGRGGGVKRDAHELRAGCEAATDRTLAPETRETTATPELRRRQIDRIAFPEADTVDEVAEECVLDVAGRDITVTSPHKVFFSERDETKLDLVRYYLAVAEPLMRAARGRPTLMQRFPHGAEGSSFFQKRVPETAPAWLQTTIVSTPNGTTSRALVLADMAHVVWA